MSRLKSAIPALMLAAGLALSSAPAALAAAAPTATSTAFRIAAGDTPVEFAQFRRRGIRGVRPGFRPGVRRGYGRRFYGRPAYGRPYGYRRHRNGAAIGAGIAGLAAGAIIGGALAQSQAAPGNAVAYCSQRFRSYDPASGTYLGYDGARHACP